MVKTRHLRASDYLEQPWKNGRGTTREIAVDAESPSRWRVSCARLEQSGPFSPYPGYDRKLVLLGGLADLVHAGRPPIHLLPLSPHAFRGEQDTHATVIQAGEDFNVMTLRGKARAGVYTATLRQDEELQLPVAGHEHFVFLVNGRLRLREQTENEEFELRPGETFRLTSDRKAEVLNLRIHGQAESSTCLWIVIHHQG